MGIFRALLRRRRNRVARIKGILLKREDPVVIEIGANDFGHTQLFLRHFRDIVLYSFEPQPAAVDLYESRIGRKETRCRFFNAAVGSYDGVAELSIAARGDRRYAGASSIAKTRFLR